MQRWNERDGRNADDVGHVTVTRSLTSTIDEEERAHASLAADATDCFTPCTHLTSTDTT